MNPTVAVSKILTLRLSQDWEVIDEFLPWSSGRKEAVPCTDRCRFYIENTCTVTEKRVESGMSSCEAPNKRGVRKKPLKYLLKPRL